MGDGEDSGRHGDHATPLTRREAEDGPPRPLRGGGRGDRPEHPAHGGGSTRDGDEDADVLLEVPDLQVEELGLDVEELRARVSLNAEVAGLLKLNVGADVDLGRVALNLKGVQAQANLRVRLDQVTSMVERVLATIDANPQVIADASRPVSAALDDAADAAGDAIQGAADVRSAADESVGGSGEAAADARGAGVGGPHRRGPAVDTAATGSTAEVVERQASAGDQRRGRSERATPPRDAARRAAERRRDRTAAARKAVGGVIAGARRTADRDSRPRKLGRSVRAGARQIGKEAGGVMYRAVKAAREAD